jgi:hypothetical protein
MLSLMDWVARTAILVLCLSTCSSAGEPTKDDEQAAYCLNEYERPPPTDRCLVECTPTPLKPPRTTEQMAKDCKPCLAATNKIDTARAERSRQLNAYLDSKSYFAGPANRVTLDNFKSRMRLAWGTDLRDCAQEHQEACVRLRRC